MNNTLPEQADRNYVIDFIKGFLVVAMVCYHTLNYFLSGYHTIYAYVNYVTQAFIFYAGFMCGTVYFIKFKENRRYVYSRLLVRGLKLIALFFILNLIIHSLLKRNFNDQELGLALFFTNFTSVLLPGNERVARFAILLPIAYLLLISTGLINLFRFKYYLYGFLFVSFCIISFNDVELPYNLSCLLTGIGGLFTGLIYNDMPAIRNNSLIKCAGITILLIFLIILIPSGIDARFNIIAYFLYVNIVIANIYLVGSYLDPKRIITKTIIKFGQYSLLLYLAQIFFLQILKRILIFRLGSLTIDHLLIFAFIIVLLVICSYLTDYLRNKYLPFDKSYRFVFS